MFPYCQIVQDVGQQLSPKKRGGLGGELGGQVVHRHHQNTPAVHAAVRAEGVWASLGVGAILISLG